MHPQNWPREAQGEPKEQSLWWYGQNKWAQKYCCWATGPACSLLAQSASHHWSQPPRFHPGFHHPSRTLHVNSQLGFCTNFVNCQAEQLGTKGVTLLNAFWGFDQLISPHQCRGNTVGRLVKLEERMYEFLHCQQKFVSSDTIECILKVHLNDDLVWPEAAQVYSGSMHCGLHSPRISKSQLAWGQQIGKIVWGKCIGTICNQPPQSASNSNQPKTFILVLKCYQGAQNK